MPQGKRQLSSGRHRKALRKKGPLSAQDKKSRGKTKKGTALKKPKSKGAKGTSIFKKKAIEKSLVRSVEQMMAGKIAQTGGGFTMPEFRALGKEQVAKLAKERELQAAKTKRIKGEDRDVRRAERVLQQAAAADEKRVA